jgi:hypothetical protein
MNQVRKPSSQMETLKTSILPILDEDIEEVEELLDDYDMGSGRSENLLSAIPSAHH